MDQLRAALPAARLARYEHACANTTTDPVDLYLWSSSVALAMFDDLSHLEVAMRSRMADRLAATYGMQWFQRKDILDSDTLKLIKTAWRQGGLSQLNASADVVHGKLVASLMFGFWVKILGRGGYYEDTTTKPDTRQRRIYDTLLWKPALRHAFPNVGDLERAKVEGSARQVQALRNRIAHHEHIVWGVPIPGAKYADGSAVRLSVTQAHNTLLNLAGYTDTGLEEWLRHHSAVPTRLAECPLANTRDILLI